MSTLRPGLAHRRTQELGAVTADLENEETHTGLSLSHQALVGFDVC